MAENKKKENSFKPKPTPSITEDHFDLLINDPDAPKKNDTSKKPVEKKNAEKKKTAKPKNVKENRSGLSDPRIRYGIGFLVLCLALFLLISFVSYFASYFNGSYSETGATLFHKAIQFDVITGKFGSYLSQVLIKESFGIGALFFVYVIGIIGLRLTIGTKIKMWNVWKHAIMLLAWLPLLFGFIHFVAPNKACELFGGAVGKFLNAQIYSFMGKSGVILTIVLVFLLYLLFEYNLNVDAIREWRERRAERRAQRKAQQLAVQPDTDPLDHDPYGDPDYDPHSEDNPDDEEDDIEDELPPITVIRRPATEQPLPNDGPISEPAVNTLKTEPVSVTPFEVVPPANNVELVVEQTPEEQQVKEGKEHRTVDTPYDPHYELSDYRFPTLDLLNDYGDKRAEVSNEELEANKNKIVETLGNYGIQIDKIKATIGPTVTLYEIVPAAGVRISKIKNLEDDIALSLAALGIRIIAPIPGKGTIGIEVPNKKPETVSMKSVLSSEKFQNNKYALPCAIGKTISNETYVF
ncbi:MAG: DNA translocase FtsK 4TM domain-containing protein, partial [Bacteroidales bacterium]|nr:DNA translocase FtsK 4TM domain-containing protein [Bacteroidales bacterium]